MRFYGDITGVSGYELEPVDVVTGGSPCQDLSIAGKRAGLAGERSGLFMEQMRVVKELRDADRKRGKPNQLIQPRYHVWENVGGAFSSNGGRDFQAVLTETVRIAEPGAPDVPLPDKGGWPKAGVLMGEHWSVAWRTHDAQYWGVPQRRKRICVLADFNGHSAAEILFDEELEREAERAGDEQAVGCVGAEPGREVHTQRESVSGNFEPGKAAREEAPGGAGGGVEQSEPICIEPRSQDGTPRIYCGGG